MRAVPASASPNATVVECYRKQGDEPLIWINLGVYIPQATGAIGCDDTSQRSDLIVPTPVFFWRYLSTMI